MLDYAGNCDVGYVDDDTDICRLRGRHLHERGDGFGLDSQAFRHELIAGAEGDQLESQPVRPGKTLVVSCAPHRCQRYGCPGPLSRVINTWIFAFATREVGRPSTR